jgi:hypothetical protein
MYSVGTWFISGICVWIPYIKETIMMVIIMIIIIMRKSAPIFFIKKTAIVNIITILCVLLTQHSRFRLEKKVVTRLLKNFLTFHRILMLES